jgi:hypothetical protein
MKKYLVAILIFLSFIFFTGMVSAQNLKNAFEAEGNLGVVAGRGAGYETGATIEQQVGSLISVALSFLGVIFLLLMIYGGYMWMTAAGNDENVKKAQSLIKAAVIGVIIVTSAYAISYFVISKLTVDSNVNYAPGPYPPELSPPTP